MVVERNGGKFGPQPYILGIYRVCLTVSVQGQPEVIQRIYDFFDFQQPCILKRTGSRAKRTQNWTSEVGLPFIQGTFD